MSPSYSIDQVLSSSQSLSVMRDRAGRPLGEGKVPLEQRRDVPMKYAKCPYSGSRYQHALPMNVSALVEIRKSWSQILSLLEELARSYRKQQKLKREISVIHLLLLCEVISQLPRAQFLNSGASSILETDVAGLYKAAIGLRSALRNLAIRCMVEPGLTLHQAIESDLLFSVIDESNFFIGTHEVCAGPNNMVQEFIEAMQKKSASSAKGRNGKSCELVKGQKFSELESLAFISNVVYFFRLVVAITAMNLCQKMAQKGPGEAAEFNSLIRRYQTNHLQSMNKSRSLGDLNMAIKKILAKKNSSIWQFNRRLKISDRLLKKMATLLKQSLDKKQSFLQAERRMVVLENLCEEFLQQLHSVTGIPDSRKSANQLNLFLK